MLKIKKLSRRASHGEQVSNQHPSMASASAPAFRFLLYCPVLTSLEEEKKCRSVSQTNPLLPMLLLPWRFTQGPLLAMSWEPSHRFSRGTSSCSQQQWKSISPPITIMLLSPSHSVWGKWKYFLIWIYLMAKDVEFLETISQSFVFNVLRTLLALVASWCLVILCLMYILDANPLSNL